MKLGPVPGFSGGSDYSVTSWPGSFWSRRDSPSWGREDEVVLPVLVLSEVGGTVLLGDGRRMGWSFLAWFFLK